MAVQLTQRELARVSGARYVRHRQADGAGGRACRVDLLAHPEWQLQLQVIIGHRRLGWCAGLARDAAERVG